jgi:hypothetical protein
MLYCSVDGGIVPVFLQNAEVENGVKCGEMYHFVRIVYVHEMMDGKAGKAVAKGRLWKE